MVSSPTLAMNLHSTPAQITESSSVVTDPNNLTSKFVWADEDVAARAQDECRDTLVDLKGFLNGDQAATQCAAEQIRVACMTHGFFQVINHGVDPGVVQSAIEQMDSFFQLPMSRKMGVQRKPGKLVGYSGAHADRFSTKLPWKETFSFHYKHVGGEGRDVTDYIKSSLGEDFQEAGVAFQQYCEQMKTLAMALFELLGISLGVDRLHFRKYFEDGYTIVRGNNYPPCKEAGLTFGTGPHTDPTSVTILYQDHVGGLEVFSDNKWQSVAPHPGSFVVNIGDTFMALTNGMYKSCLHRAVVNREIVRRSIAFFVNPNEEKTVSPPMELLKNGEHRKYPDFIWYDLVEFTQTQYRVDGDTLQNFINWFTSKNGN